MDGRVHLYLMHPLGEPDIIDMIENGPAEGVNEYGPAELVNEYGPAEGVKDHEPTDCINDVEGNEGVNEGGSNRGVNQKRPIAEGVIEKEAVQATDKGKGVRIDDDIIDDLLNEVDYEEESEDSAIGIQFDDSEEECILEDHFENEGGETVLDEGGVVDETTVDETVTTKKGNKGKDASVSQPKKKRGRPKKKTQTPNIVVVEGEQQIEQGDDLFEQQDVGARDKGKGKATDGGLSDVEDCNSDELHSGNDSEDEEQSNVKKDKFPTFKLLKDMRDYNWEVGTYFACKEEFQYAIKCYSIQSARAVKFKKNDKTRMRVICKPGCKWAAYCAHIPGQETWQLRKIHDDHKCNREPHVPLLSSNCDQQKGLLPAIEELLPGVGQRFCVRHLYNNFRKKFPGMLVKNSMSRCKLPGHNKSTCKLPCPPQQAPTQSGTSQTAPATQAPATQPAASQPTLATQPAATQPALATQSVATQQAASQPALATRPVASQSVASNSQQPPSKKKEERTI
ncbi:hypothetical protein P8452_70493 [Trifolium repens]|nr:hypothetical protein P8452_70493 [Trifolium repens]